MCKILASKPAAIVTSVLASDYFSDYLVRRSIAPEDGNVPKMYCPPLQQKQLQ